MKVRLQWRSISITAILTFVVVLVVNKLVVIHNMHDSTGRNPSSTTSSFASATVEGSKITLLRQMNRIQPTTDHAALLDENMNKMKSLLSGSPSQPSINTIPAQSLKTQPILQQLDVPKTEIVNVSLLELHVRSDSIAVVPKARTAQSKLSSIDKFNSYVNNMPPYLGISWQEFLKLRRFEDTTISNSEIAQLAPLSQDFQPISFCSKEVENSLKLPRLTPDQQKWCKWALSGSGGRVVVGKSWGNLKTKREKEDFDDFNCNAFSQGINPSCDASWGDETVANWIKSTVDSIKCKPGSSSSVTCRDNENGDRQCTFKNAQINFAYMYDSPRPAPAVTPSKKFKKGFFSVDCRHETADNFLKFEHLYSSALPTQKCDYVINGTVLLYSHDDIRNLGHTMNDIMNVYLLRWLHRIARHSNRITFLNIDSFNLGHNHYDTISNPFYSMYNRTFDLMVRGRDFGTKTLCMQNVIMQSSPPKFFVWDSWFRDHDCTFRGPSTLFQRYNLEVRSGFGFLKENENLKTNKKIRVLMLVRKQSKNLWGDSQTSRNHLNQPEVDEVVNATLLEAYPDAVYESVSFEQISFDKQMEILSETTILIGMHGAGITQGLHMPIGTKYCCGVIEIFPSGYFFPIRGHANMMRKTGIKYERLEIDSSASTSTGATIPATALATLMIKMIDTIVKAPSCILRTAYEDPYLETI